jgi:cysteinyl-tRNA synthetase
MQACSLETWFLIMKLYNTLTRKKEEFVPVEEGKVRMYVCGPTVYNYIHIGNARPVIIFDTARRYMEYKGYEVNYVSNFTDVDDKIIKKAMEEGVPASEISTRFIAEFKKDMESLNVLPATKHPLATEEIPGMLEMIGTLIEKGYAYAKEGTVYFRTKKFEEYGKLSKKNLDELEAGKRIAVEEQKEDEMDFVLWKPKKDGEPYWESPWGNGRPGWHIECSVMSKKYLGDEIDIHAGGEDLIFPHHENEIAQSEACNGKQFAKYWLHNAFLNIDNKKMSKSLNNFFTVRDISEKYDLQVLRFFMISAHYRSPINFSEELMEASKNGLDRILTAVDNLKHLAGASTVNSITEEESANLKLAAEFVGKFEAAMDDDFNSADAVSSIFELVKFTNTNSSVENSKEYLDELYKEIKMLCQILGIIIDKEADILAEDIEKLIEERQAARKAKNFARSDEIRDELLAKGIVLEDTREGVKWKKA